MLGFARCRHSGVGIADRTSLMLKLARSCLAATGVGAATIADVDLVPCSRLSGRHPAAVKGKRQRHFAAPRHQRTVAHPEGVEDVQLARPDREVERGPDQVRPRRHEFLDQLLWAEVMSFATLALPTHTQDCAQKAALLVSSDVNRMLGSRS